MSISAQLQTMIADRLEAAGSLRLQVPIVSRRDKDMAKQIEEAATKGGGLYGVVLPTLPMQVAEDMPFVFVESGEVRVRFVELPPVNKTGVTAWDLIDDAAIALHWHCAPPLAHPLQLAAQAIEDLADKRIRYVDLILRATYQLPRRAVATAAFVPGGSNARADLQAFLLAQLGAGMALGGSVPTLALTDHDQANEIARSGHALKVEVLPARPARAMQGIDVPFFESYEVRVKVTEEPALNMTGMDMYDVLEDVMTAAHFQPCAGFLAQPLRLASRPTSYRTDGLNKREVDVIFNATLGFEPTDN